MGETTGIEWTDATWNPWRGCRKVSPACAHCYMFREQTRYGRDPNTVVRASDATFYMPLKWKESWKVFTCSWSDFFIEEADQYRAEAYNVISQTQRHTYQILTKRPERIVRSMPTNCWLGVSLENRRFYCRIEQIQKVDAAVRFLSIEPLLGPMPDIPLDGISWAILGGESGPGYRPFNLDWACQIVERCRAANVAVFVKQLGGWPNKHGDMNQFPPDLRIREFPVARLD